MHHGEPKPIPLFCWGRAETRVRRVLWYVPGNSIHFMWLTCIIEFETDVSTVEASCMLKYITTKSTPRVVLEKYF